VSDASGVDTIKFDSSMGFITHVVEWATSFPININNYLLAPTSIGLLLAVTIIAISFSTILRWTHTHIHTHTDAYIPHVTSTTATSSCPFIQAKTIPMYEATGSSAPTSTTSSSSASVHVQETSDYDDAANEAALYRLLDFLPDGVVMVSLAGRLVYVNNNAASLFGYTVGELIDQPLEILVPPISRVVHRGYFNHALSGLLSRPMGGPLQISGCAKDGTLIPVAIALASTSSLALKPTRSVAMAFIRDNRMTQQVPTPLFHSPQQAQSSNSLLVV
jgi:PAS domain S-box-containing protein